MENKKKNNKYLFWGLGNAGEGFISSVSSTYLSIFLTDVALLPLGIVSFVSIFSSIFDFFLVPLSAIILVSARNLKWGRFRTWLVVCPPLVVLFFIMCFSYVPNNAILSAVIILTGYILARAGWNITYASNASLTAVLSLNDEMSSKLTSQRMMGSNAGRLMGNYLTPLIVALVASWGLSEGSGYKVMILITGVFYIGTNLLHFYASKDRDTSGEVAEKKEDKGLSFKETIKALVANPQLFLTLIIDLTSNVSSLVLPSLAVYYYKYCAGNMKLTSTHMLIIGLGGITGATIVRIFGDKIKNYRTWLLTIYLCIATILFSHRFVAGNPYLFMAFSGIVAVMTGMTQPFELNLYIDNTVYYKQKTGVDATGFIMGLSNLPVKFASIVKSTLIPFTLMAVGYVANAEATPEMKKAIINAYTLVPTVFPIVGFILLKFFYKLGKNKPLVREATEESKEN